MGSTRCSVSRLDIVGYELSPSDTSMGSEAGSSPESGRSHCDNACPPEGVCFSRDWGGETLSVRSDSDEGVEIADARIEGWCGRGGSRAEPAPEDDGGCSVIIGEKGGGL